MSWRVGQKLEIVWRVLVMARNEDRHQLVQKVFA